MDEPVWLAALRQLIDSEDLLDDPADCWTYGYDNSRRHHPPEAVVFAREEKQIQELVGFCRKHHIPLTSRGLGTNTTGAGVPTHGGIVLSTERMNQLLEIDPEAQTARVQPGLINQQLQNEAAKHQLFWAPDPSSAPFCTVGGNLACNAAGPRAIKYGTCRDNTLRLRAVTGSGEIITTGTLTRKGVVGLDLLRLLIGSEGTLAIFIEATLLLRPLPEAQATIRALYDNASDAMAAVCRLLAQPTLPCMLEFMDAACLDLLREDGSVSLPDSAQALLLIEVDGAKEEVPRLSDAMVAAAGKNNALDIQIAHDAQARKALWQARKTLSPALRRIAPDKINEDVVVPVERLGELLARIADLRTQFPFPIVCFGHAGSGNLHVNLLPDDTEAQRATAQECLHQVFDAVIELNGTLSGEHGVGLAKRDHITRELEPAALHLMHAIKRDFDPDGILNPDKVLPTA